MCLLLSFHPCHLITQKRIVYFMHIFFYICILISMVAVVLSLSSHSLSILLYQFGLFPLSQGTPSKAVITIDDLSNTHDCHYMEGLYERSLYERKK